ncbi:MAG TPA: ChrR family anti-sigma-E factor [Aestuariivirgaceae bacterium]|nr:ChrR family anti-sigma-E factor [Aestuariivirgaceae bacterium]
MRTEHHVTRSTLHAYAAGELCEALSVVAASHLAWCRECRKAVATAATAPDVPRPASDTAPSPVSASGETALQAMDRQPRTTERPGSEVSEISDFGLPMPLAHRLDGHGLDKVAWRKVFPGVAVRELALSAGAAGQLRLVRIAPGKALPEHGHGSGELSLVLRGAYRDGLGRYTIGDVADLDGAAVHRPVAEDAGCICLVAAETPVRYRSWLSRIWQRLTRA